MEWNPKGASKESGEMWIICNEQVLMLRSHSGQEGCEAGIRIFQDLVTGNFLSTGVSRGKKELLE